MLQNWLVWYLNVPIKCIYNLFLVYFSRPNCTLRPGAVCSDKNSPCCQSCQYMGPGEKCREAQLATCEKESLCLGNIAECPKSSPMADGTLCLEKGQCKSGRCIPYCETLGKQSCMCDKCKSLFFLII